MHEHSCFVTLTYNDENLPMDRSVLKRDWQTFMKRLRKALAPIKIRFYMCAEYGETTIRPHYHALIYGWEFPDRTEHTKTEVGNILYISETLDAIWGKGNCQIGQITFDSAAYCARYVLKKQNGDYDEEHYEVDNLQTCTGIRDRKKEYTLSSTCRGLGYSWLKKYKNDLKKGYLTLNGCKMGIPAYYIRQLEEIDLKLAEQIKEKHRQSIDQDDPELSLARLRVKEKIKRNKAKSLTRTI